jgi:hypothetical protein
VGKDFVEHFMSVFTCWIETLNPHQPPPTQGVHAQLAVQGKFPRVFVGPEGVPLAVITTLLFFVTMKIDLRWKNGGSSDGGGGSSSGGGLALWLPGCSYYIY